MGSLNDRLAGPAPADRPEPVPPVCATTDPASSQENYKWAIIAPAYSPSEDVLLVIDPACLAEARAENPGMVTWLASEAELLAPFKDNHDFMRGIHRIKKHLGGWLREVRPPRGDAQTGQVVREPVER
ncbi:MAG: hypothetical protein PHF00_09510 [Elusimicrobia bacterium]|nr:hypothetical protein [Elusimicrobiota bacterium]